MAYENIFYQYPPNKNLAVYYDSVSLWLLTDRQLVIFLTNVYFNQYASGSPTINSEDFARILLQHTAYNLESVFARLPSEKDEVIASL